MTEINNEHLSLRGQFNARLSNEILKNPDAAFIFTSIVCETVSVSDLPLIEIALQQRLKNPTGISNN
ncbi:MAG: hypothetical protein Q4E83_03790 [bacterium]|nr:hypothetical protein [bacterium]